MGRLASLRVWLLAAMLGSGAVGIVLAYMTAGGIGRSHEASEDRNKAQMVANAVAVQARQGAGPAQFASLQRVLPSDQLIVVRHGRVAFSGSPLRAREVEVTVSAPFPGGKVTLIDHESSESSASTAAVVAGLAVAVLVISAALAVSSLITRSVREPLARAIEVSDRIAGGDLSARMGTSGPDALSATRWTGSGRAAGARPTRCRAGRRPDVVHGRRRAGLRDAGARLGLRRAPAALARRRRPSAGRRRSRATRRGRRSTSCSAGPGRRSTGDISSGCA